MNTEEIKTLTESLTEDLNKVLIKLQAIETLQERREKESLSGVAYSELKLLTLKTAINDVINGTNNVTDMFDEYAMSYNQRCLMVLIGSRALQHYIPNIGRVVHDWDFMVSKKELEKFHSTYSQHLIKTVNGVTLYEIPSIGVVELSCVEGWMPSDFLMYEACLELTETFFGKALVPPLNMLYEMKLATAEFIKEPKHEHDVELMEVECVKFGEKYSEFYHMRRAEIKARLEKETKVKYDFFHKYHIPEYIKHDYLHEVIVDLIGQALPTYIKITTAETDIGEELFNRLTHQEKVSLMAEESLVLALERWFVPQMVENGINFKLLEVFDNNNEGLPTYKILKHCCITGLKGEAEYITNFSRANFFEIEKLWIDYKQKIKEKGGFSSDFYCIIFKLREDYKKGINVATIQEN